MNGSSTRKRKISRLGSVKTKGDLCKKQPAKQTSAEQSSSNSCNIEYEAVEDSGFQMEENSGRKTVAVAGIEKPTVGKAIQSCVAGKGAIPRAESRVVLWKWVSNDHSCHGLFSGIIELSRLRTQMYSANIAHFINCLLLPWGLTSLTYSHKKPQLKLGAYRSGRAVGS